MAQTGLVIVAVATALLPGDLAVWDGHVALVVGNGTGIPAGNQHRCQAPRGTGATVHHMTHPTPLSREVKLAMIQHPEHEVAMFCGALAEFTERDVPYLYRDVPFLYSVSTSTSCCLIRRSGWSGAPR